MNSKLLARFLLPLTLLIMLTILLLPSRTAVFAEQPLERWAGTISDEYGLPLAATVTINGQSVQADADGSFELDVETAEDNRYVINAQMLGYASLSHIHIGSPIEAMALTLKEAREFEIEPSQAIEIEDERGTQLSIPPDSLIDADGNPATAPLQLFLYTYDLQAGEMPGDMTGRNSEGQMVALETSGAFFAEFRDAEGNLYNLAPDVQAEISVPVSSALPELPDVIALWSYEQESGLWLEEGEAIRVDERYVGQVSHFSAWNFDLVLEEEACIKLTVEPSLIPVDVRAEVYYPPSTSASYVTTLHLTDPINVLHNIPANPPTNAMVRFYVPDTSTTPYAVISPGAPWGGSGVPPYPYEDCKAELHIEDSREKGSINGRKFHDLNNNRMKDANEPGLEGWEITLTDADNNSFTTTTDADGNYQFTNLPPGSTSVSEVQQAGWVQTYPPTVKHSFVLTPGYELEQIDFGNTEPCENPTTDLCTAGRADQFQTSDGSEPSSPSQELINWASLRYHTLLTEFDVIPTDRFFIHTFGESDTDTCLSGDCLIVGATLTITLQAGPSSLAWNDTIGFMQNGKDIWHGRISSLPGSVSPWTPGSMATIALDLANLPAYKGVTNVLAALQDGKFDLYVQDDTGVDSIQLEVEKCCDCTPPPPDMVGWWHLDETSGSTAADIAMYPNDGTYINAPTPTSGKVDNALHFARANDYVSVPNHSSLNFGAAPSGDFSIDAWVYPEVTQPGKEWPIVTKWADGIGYEFLIMDGRLALMLGDPSGKTMYTDFTAPFIPYNAWTHVAVTVDRDDPNGIIFYIDGVPIPSPHNPTLVSGSLVNDAPLYLGASPYSDFQGPIWQYFEGTMDEVELFKRALDPSEIKAIYSVGSAGKCKCVTPPDNMVGWWHLDEMTGTLAADIAMYPNDGTHINNPTPITGKVDGALSFNGIDQYVEVPDHPEINFGTGDFSIDAWIRTDSNETYEVFIDKRDTTPVGYQLLLYNGHLSFQLADVTSSWSNYYNPSSPDLRDGKWHFVAVTVDRGQSTGGKLYVDGNLIHTFSPMNRPGSITNAADLWIGKHHANSAFNIEMWFDGDIDEVELFNRALAEDEIKAIYRAGSSGKCKCVTPPDNMAGWWHLDEMTGTLAADIAMYPNDGTHINNPTPVTGKVDGALSFNGIDQYVEVPDNSEINVGPAIMGTDVGDFSIDAWVKTTDSSGVKIIVDKRYEDPSTYAQGYSLFLGNGQLEFQLAEGNGSWVCSTNPTTSSCTNYGSGTFVADGKWHLVAVTVDRDQTNGGKFYVDGVPVATFDPTIRSRSLTNTKPLRIGSRSSFETGLFNGAIDEVELFKRVLTEDEIKAIYRAGSSGKCKCEEKEVTLLAGEPDDFDTANGTESPSPSVGLQSRYGTSRNFDTLHSNQRFFHTFSDLLPEINTSEICSATLEIRVKPGRELMYNDTISLMFVDAGGNVLAAPWGRYFGSGNAKDGWFNYQWGNTPKAAETIILDLDALPLALADGGGTVSILGYLNLLGYLDVYVQDDTGVDYVKLTVHYCCEKSEGPDIELTKRHTETFTYGQNEVYTLDVTNVGNAAASGPITVSDRLPAGMSFVSGAPAPWTCSAVGQNVTCTHPGPLAAGASSSISLTVAIAPVHQFPGGSDLVTNCAQASTPGDVNSGNDADCDSTIIVTSSVGGISGTVSTNDSRLLSGIPVEAYRLDGDLWEPIDSTTTNVTGEYTLNNLPTGSYRVHFTDPSGTFAAEYYDDVSDFADATEISVTDDIMVSDINAILEPSLPPEAEVEVEGGSTWIDPSTGEIWIGFAQTLPDDASVTIQRDVTCPDGVTPTSVVLQVSSAPGFPSFSATYPMSETPPGSGQYVVTLTDAEMTTWPRRVELTLTIQWDCDGDVQTEPIGGTILIDPSGNITDAETGELIANATVTLYKVPGWLPKSSPEDDAYNTCQSHNSKDPGEPWDQPAPTDLGTIANPATTTTREISPAVNPQITGKDGRYAWDVVEGCWYVIVQAEGYQTKVSPVVGVPPEVTDLHLELTPFKATITRDSDDISLSWPHLDAGTTYQVWRSPNADFRAALAGSSQVGTVTSTTGEMASYVDSGAASDGSNYYYIVRALDSDGQVMGTSSRVGLFKISVSPGWNLLSWPLLPAETSLDAVIGSQLHGTDDPLTADRILVWDEESQSYSSAWFCSGGCEEWGEPWANHWLANDYSPSALTLEPDTGFWLQNRSGATETIMLLGDVATSARAVEVASGWQTLASTFPSARSLDDLNLPATGTDDPLTADRILVWDAESNSFTSAWYCGGACEDWGEPWANHWLANDYSPSPIVIEPGHGFWYQNRHEPFTWDNPQ